MASATGSHCGSWTRRATTRPVRGPSRHDVRPRADRHRRPLGCRRGRRPHRRRRARAEQRNHGDQPGRNLPSGASETFTAPSTPGPVQYLCTLRNGMIGVLNVVAAPTPTPYPAPITPAQTVTPATSLVSGVSTSRRTWKVTVRFQLSADANVTARLKTRNGTRTLKKVPRALQAGSRSVTINRSFTGGARYRVLLEIVDDAGN